MRRAQGNPEVQLLECVNPVKDKWRVRWDVQQREDGSTDYMEHEFGHRPTDDEINTLITEWYNTQTEEAILSGFEWNGMKVWLSQENQSNYKAAFDAAAIANLFRLTLKLDAVLPITFKFGTDEQPVFYEFTSLSELADFHFKALAYIQTTLEKGWKNKSAIDLSLYR